MNGGLECIVDDEDFDKVSYLKWFNIRGYAARQKWTNGKPSTLYMHRLILDAPKDMDVDHANGNTLDNRKSNIRLSTTQQNMHNTKTYKSSTSGYKGVKIKDEYIKTTDRSRKPNRKIWVAMLNYNGKQRYIGYFSTPEEAAKAYDKKAREIYGEFAKTNF